MNSSQDTSRHEERLHDLIELWHTGDADVPLIEFLYLKPEEYAAYVEGNITAEDVMVKYDARSR